MQEHTDDQTTRTTGRGYNRQINEPERDAAAAGTNLYSPIPGDDNNTRPGMVEDIDPRPATPTVSNVTRTHHESAETYGRSPNPTTRPVSTYTMGMQSQSSGHAIMQKIQENPLAVVAAATAGGMLVGRMLRNRGQRNEPGYLRATGYDDWAYRSPQPYRQPAFYSSQARAGYQGYQPPMGYQGTPQYRAEQEFRPEQGFQSRHDNFPGDSHWD